MTRDETVLVVMCLVKTGASNKVAYLEQTCTACPSQWEGKMEDGRYVYIRYRWGALSWTVGEETQYRDTMDANDGFMSTDDMLRLTGLALLPGVIVKNTCGW